MLKTLKKDFEIVVPEVHSPVGDVNDSFSEPFHNPFSTPHDAPERQERRPEVTPQIIQHDFNEPAAKSTPAQKKKKQDWTLN